MKFHILLFLTTVLLFLAGCSGHSDARLEHIAGIVSGNPEEAISLLDSIDPGALSTADRHYYDLLTIKANDKAYVTHKSDSLILSVIDYYSTHEKDLYPEALYYGGRVYSDLGDYPSALRYFQQSLDLLPEDTEKLKLKGHVLSQTGRLLNTLRLYEQSIPYMEKVIRINSQLKDSVNLLYNMQLLGAIYMHMEKYYKAEPMFKAAREIAKKVSPVDQHQQDIYLAAIKYFKDEQDSALNLIRKAIPEASHFYRNFALAYGARIYLECDILDTAYIYARELINNDLNNKATGYGTILSPKLRKLVPPDSINIYVSDYRELMEHTLNQNESQEALLQNTLYNYQLHERERIKAEKDKAFLKECMLGFVIVILLMAFIIVYLKNRNKSSIIRLQQSLDNINKLKYELSHVKSNLPSIEGSYTSASAEEDNQASNSISTVRRTTENELRERLRNELLSISEISNNKYFVPDIILQSEVYERLQKMIMDSRSIKDNDEIWTELINVVTQSSPKFITNLNLLTSGKLTSLDLHTALLIKCGFKPTQMAILLGKSNGTIVSRRETLCIKVLDEKLSIKVIDNIIRLL